MRIVVALILLVHGAAHLVGFVGAWRLVKTVPYPHTLFGTLVDLGDAGVELQRQALVAARASWRRGRRWTERRSGPLATRAHWAQRDRESRATHCANAESSLSGRSNESV